MKVQTTTDLLLLVRVFVLGTTVFIVTTGCEPSIQATTPTIEIVHDGSERPDDPLMPTGVFTPKHTPSRPVEPTVTATLSEWPGTLLFTLEPARSDRTRELWAYRAGGEWALADSSLSRSGFWQSYVVDPTSADVLVITQSLGSSGPQPEQAAVLDLSSRAVNPIHLPEDAYLASNVAWSAAQRFVVYETEDGIFQYDLHDSSVREVSPHGTGIALSPQGDAAAYGLRVAGTGEFLLSIMNLDTGEETQFPEARFETASVRIWWSPDGTRIAVSNAALTGCQVSNLELATRTIETLASGAQGSRNCWATWSPDSQRLIVSVAGPEGVSRHIVTRDGDAILTLDAEIPDVLQLPSVVWAPDGSGVVWTEPQDNATRLVWLDVASNERSTLAELNGYAILKAWLDSDVPVPK